MIDQVGNLPVVQLSKTMFHAQFFCVCFAWFTLEENGYLHFIKEFNYIPNKFLCKLKQWGTM